MRWKDILPPVLLVQKLQQNRVTKSKRVGYAQSYQITIYSSINQYTIQYKMQKNAKKEQKPHFFTIHCQIQHSWTQSHDKSRTKKSTATENLCSGNNIKFCLQNISSAFAPYRHCKHTATKIFATTKPPLVAHRKLSAAVVISSFVYKTYRAR